MARLNLLFLLLLLTACGTLPAGEAPTAAPARSSATTPIRPTDTPPTAPPAVAPTASATAQPPAASIHYLLPPDFNVAYSVDPQSIVVDPTRFSLRITPLGLEPGPETTIRLMGGSTAAAIWRENQPGGMGALIEAIPVRGGSGTLASSGFGATIAWLDGRTPYAADLTGTTPEPMRAWVEALVTYDLPTWTALVQAAAPGPLRDLRYFLPADFPAAYPDYRRVDAIPLERGYTLRLYPAGIAAEPTDSATITLLAGEPAAPLAAQAFAEPAALISEPLTLRGLPGRLAVLPGSLLITWIEAGVPYALVFDGIGEDVEAWQALAAGLIDVGQAAWEQQVPGDAQR